MTKTTNLQLRILSLLLRPAVRFCLRYGLHIQDLIEASKFVFLSMYSERLAQGGNKSNPSRLSAGTGVHRREITRIVNRQELQSQPRGILARVLGQWQFDPDFLDENGRARKLTIDSGTNEFHQLVARVSRDLNPGTLLFELERLGAVKRNTNSVQLVSKSYIPKGDIDAGDELLGADIDNLSQAVEQNLLFTAVLPNLHATTEFDNLSLSAVPELREWILTQGSLFHSRVREHLSKFDLDLNPKLKSQQGGGRIVFTSFSLSQPQTINSPNSKDSEESNK